MITHLQQHLTNNLPFLKDKKLLLGISGGIDSMVLAHLLNSLGYSIYIAHCNFGLRSDESDGDEVFVQNFASENNIPFFVIRFNTNEYAIQHKLSIQIAARRLRYEWFENIMTENRLDYLLTAHHLDDSAETFLINFTRGTGLEGLLGIPQQNGNIIRPLLPFTRDAIVTYAKKNNIAWREDSSNASDKYLRNKLRHHVLPILKELNPSFAGSFTDTITHLQQAQALVQDASAMLYENVITGRGDSMYINLLALLEVSNYKAYLYQWLTPFGFTAWHDVYSLVTAQSGKYVAAPGYRLIKNRSELILESVSKQDNEVYEIPWNIEKTTKPVGLKFEKVANITQTDTKNAIFINSELIKFPLFVRKWREGDYFYPIGMKGQKKKVSKFFKDEKFSLPEKERTWLLCSGEDIIWIIGHRADERFKTDTKTTQILKIEVLLDR